MYNIVVCSVILYIKRVRDFAFCKIPEFILLYVMSKPRPYVLMYSAGI